MQKTSEQPSITAASSSSSLPDRGVVSNAGRISVTGGNSAAKSWADQARDLRAADQQQVFIRNKLTVRVCEKALNSTIKAVPRQLTCFVGRLYLDVTEEDLAAFLH